MVRRDAGKIGKLKSARDAAQTKEFVARLASFVQSLFVLNSRPEIPLPQEGHSLRWMSEPFAPYT